MAESKCDPIEIMVANFQETIEGMEEDLKSAVEVAWNRGATAWVQANYPRDYARLAA